MSQENMPGTNMLSTTDDEFWRRCVDRRMRDHYEEESERARLDIEPVLNGYQMAEEQGDKHSHGQIPSEIADAGDLAGG